MAVTIEQCQRKRVLICTDLYPDSDVRGPASQTHAVKDLVEGAVLNGLQVVGIVRFKQIISRKPLIVPRRIDLGGIKIFDVPVFGYRNIFFPRPSIWICRQMLSGINFEVILSHMSMSYVRARKIIGKGKPHYLVVHQGDFSVSTLWPALKCADRVYVRSHSIKKKLQKRFPSVKVDGQIFSGIDDALIRRGGADYRAEKFDSSSVKMLFCGSLIPLKNVDKIIKSVLDLRKRDIKAELTIIGDGPSKQYLRELTMDLGLTQYVNFTGWLSKDEVLSKMRSSSFYVMPSKPETLGLAYLEAMASGCVVVGHENEGIDGIVRDSFNGYLVGSATPEEISSKIEQFLLLSNEGRHKLLKRSQRTVRFFTASRAGRNYAELIGG